MVDSPYKPDVVTVAITRVDGGVTIMRMVTAEYRPTTPEEQAHGDGARVQRWSKPATPARVDAAIVKYNWQGPQAPVSWRFVPDDYLDANTDDTFRDAWTDDGSNKPGHDMVKARDIHATRLRRQRVPLLESLDKEWMRETGRGRKAQADAVEAKRERLRDFAPVQAAIDAAQTVDVLKGVRLPDV